MGRQELDATDTVRRHVRMIKRWNREKQREIQKAKDKVDLKYEPIHEAYEEKYKALKRRDNGKI